MINKVLLKYYFEYIIQTKYFSFKILLEIETNSMSDKKIQKNIKVLKK